MQRILLMCSFALALGACDKSGSSNPPDDGGHHHDEAGHHGGGDHHEGGMEHDHGDVEGKTVIPAGEAKVGDVTQCPVSGETFVVTADSPSLDHDGKTYYFCCANCKAKAEAEPDKYLSKAPE